MLVLSLQVSVVLSLSSSDVRVGVLGRLRERAGRLRACRGARSFERCVRGSLVASLCVQRSAGADQLPLDGAVRVAGAGGDLGVGEPEGLQPDESLLAVR
jgi:hypothetical protein